MNNIIVLYNPLSHEGKGLEDARKLEKFYPDVACRYVDMTSADFAWADSLKAFDEDDMIILTGGDGTLNRAVNRLKGWDFSRQLYFYPSGTGNDFINDLNLKKTTAPFLLDPYLKHLPMAEINGEPWVFINGAGFGLDGYACVEHERKKAEGKQKSYIICALEGLLSKYKPVSGRITVDGETLSYQQIWLAPVMLGSYFGGGFKIASMQDRMEPEHTLTSVAVHDVGRLKACFLFVFAMKGFGHLFPKHITYRKGHVIEAEFDAPADMQVDGEVISGVTHYSAVLN